MRKSKFSESQIMGVLAEGEAGLPVGEVCRKHGISSATYYQWKSKYAGMSVPELKRVKELEAENARLKRLYADLALESAAIKDVLSRKFGRRPPSAPLSRCSSRSTGSRGRVLAGSRICRGRRSTRARSTGRCATHRSLMRSTGSSRNGLAGASGSVSGGCAPTVTAGTTSACIGSIAE
jgi:putative transposase